jgi:ABC-type sulfate/molybdate transport systems ATPase subunit
VLDADFSVDRREFTVGVTLRVAAGERLALFGPSGAGKTTVLEAIAGLVQPTRGRIELGGRLLTSSEAPSTNVPAWQRRVGLLRQDPGLFPHLSVRANLTYARESDATPAELTELAARLGIVALLGARPAALSGGQAHRVALGRMLLAHSQVLLLDEPYTGLDEGLRRQLTELVGDLVQARGVPAVLVAHELESAQAFADRIAVIDAGQILQDAPPDQVVLAPAARRVAELVGYRAFVPADNQLPPVRSYAGVHPERVTTGAHPDQGLVLEGTVLARRPAGAGWEADLDTRGCIVTCRLPDKPPDPGGTLVVTALQPPYFAPDGAALPEPTREPKARRCLD